MADIKAFPAKAFFVNMLTRDIDLADAILDLIDNCVDGILRTYGDQGKTKSPYNGYYAKITINKDEFIIEDNCGGIPLDVAKEYAFRMGRPDNNSQNLPTVGFYGIGMKRAIFKMGKNSTVSSYNSNDKFKVKINEEWLRDDSAWTLPFQTLEDSNLKKQGTIIEIKDLYNNISEEFSDDSYVNKLKKLVSQHYSFIINKGFQVYINEKEIKPKDILFFFTNETSEENISPYIYEGEINGVKVDLKVGIYRETPSQEEIEDELIMKRTSDDSGWTVICNDRVVLYNDKTILTGWGEATVPSFHNQFIGITGIVHFQSSDVDKLPLTTTKRGIDASSKVYLHTKKYMREGTKVFTSYTNQIKRDIEREKEYLANSKQVSFEELNQKEFPSIQMKTITKTEPNEINAKKYKPTLPIIRTSTENKVIRFNKKQSEIEKVSNFLFEVPDRSPSEVGSECFNIIYQQIKKEE